MVNTDAGQSLPGRYEKRLIIMLCPTLQLDLLTGENAYSTLLHAQL